ncbi:alpha/beta hydrolase-fold protein [Paenibacillus sp. GCM10012307]|uniref:Alpha/beta hydrolase n=1 Tax=Paenibacillus roseus TaxID=2798579 RepID=A0A934J5E7_9BACL|nr:alpha/beta hydrolase-fold protein [Paenibacillus roseus]MBJ6360658.1 alpha/beta hydrolase [Paenibacillus roseus]
MTSRIETIPGFSSRILHTERDIFVYLPPGYDANPGVAFPVLYMHDGQYMFAEDRFGDSWNVHKTLNRLIGEGNLEEIIVVAVSSLSHVQRLSEYFHDVPSAREAFPSEWSGALFEQFLIDEVKTHIDRTYRTLPDRQHTGMIGSSAGGLLSYHIGFRRPDVFGKIGIMSPFFFYTVWDGAQRTEIQIYESFNTKPPIRVWLDMGGAEGLLTVSQARSVADEMIGNGFKAGHDLAFFLDPEAAHTQQAWADRIQAPLLYMFGKTGTPQSIRLYGRTIIGLWGLKVRLYPNVSYDSGFVMSLLEAEYDVANPDMATVAADGSVTAYQIGTTEVTVRYAGLQSTVALEVVPEIKETVQIDITIEVPLDTPKDDRIYAGFEIPKAEDGLYRGSYVLPRDLKFDVPIINEFGRFEKNYVNRRFSTENDASFHFKIAEWE